MQLADAVAKSGGILAVVDLAPGLGHGVVVFGDRLAIEDPAQNDVAVADPLRAQRRRNPRIVRPAGRRRAERLDDGSGAVFGPNVHGRFPRRPSVHRGAASAPAAQSTSPARQRISASKHDVTRPDGYQFRHASHDRGARLRIMPQIP